MEQFVLFGRVARFTSKHEIFRITRTSFGNRHDMINMIPVLNRRFAVITLGFLRLALAIYIGFRKFTTRVKLFSAAHRRAYFPLFSIVVKMVAVMSSSRCIVSVFIISSPPQHKRSVSFKVRFVPLRSSGYVSILVLLLPFAHMSTVARFAQRTKSVFATFVPMEIFGSYRVFIAALWATLNRGIHSASLSLSRMRDNIGGRYEFRFSGINLADIDIVPKNRTNY